MTQLASTADNSVAYTVIVKLKLVGLMNWTLPQFIKIMHRGGDQYLLGLNKKMIAQLKFQAWMLSINSIMNMCQKSNHCDHYFAGNTVGKREGKKHATSGVQLALLKV